MLGTEINDDIANLLVAQFLLSWNQKTLTRTSSSISTRREGTVTAGLAAYDTMQYIEPKVSTICIGKGNVPWQQCSLQLGKRICGMHYRIRVS